VFVHGCFWHGCPEHQRDTKSNTKWWVEKIAANKARDARFQQRLTDAGWTWTVVWEHDAPAVAAERVEALVRGALGGAPRGAVAA
jgi:DNA mismatch endonuclease (patch repair protein)